MNAAAFDATRFHSLLEPGAPGHDLRCYQTVGTTMTIAAEAARAGAPDGTIILAEEQTAGRGRRGRSFHSPPGANLYFTVVLRLDAPAASRLAIALPLAVAEAIIAETELAARIKWPNDIWLGERKVSGMLIDASTVGTGGVLALAGIGINVNGDPAENRELRDIATSLARGAGRPINREGLLARICNGLAGSLDRPHEELLPRYRALSLVLGRQVRIESTGDRIEGLAESLDENGNLVLRHPDGTRSTHAAGDVTLRPIE